MSSPRVFAFTSAFVTVVLSPAATARPAVAAAPRVHVAPRTVAPVPEKIERSIAMTVNGDPVATETPPFVQGGRVLVPLRVVFDALAIAVVRRGPYIDAELPSGHVRITVGSRNLTIGTKAVELDAPVTDIDGTTYATLRVVRLVLGADTSYDARAARVSIVSGYIGRAASGEQAADHGGTNVQGVVAAVDANSAPPTVTVTVNGNPRTISITSNAKIYVEDVSIHSQIAATMADIRVGDALRALLTRSGRVAEVHDFFKSISGTISAVSEIGFVLQTGRVVSPAKTTEISLNQSAATQSDLRVGDFVTVRSNPETGELRQVIASRNAVTTSVPAGAVTSPGAPGDVTPPAIGAVTLDKTRPLHAGESFVVTLNGTPGGHADFDIGDYVTGIPMQEATPGVYRGHFRIPDRFNVAAIPVYGHLTVAGVSAPRATAAGQLSAATTPPQVIDVAPPSGQTVNNSRPSIYATFGAPSDVGIDLSTAQISVNGHDVTSSSTRTPAFVAYTPGIDYSDGPVTVAVRVADQAGNIATRSWTFTIRTR